MRKSASTLAVLVILAALFATLTLFALSLASSVSLHEELESSRGKILNKSLAHLRAGELNVTQIQNAAKVTIIIRTGNRTVVKVDPVTKWAISFSAAWLVPCLRHKPGNLPVKDVTGTSQNLMSLSSEDRLYEITFRKIEIWLGYADPTTCTPTPFDYTTCSTPNITLVLVPDRWDVLTAGFTADQNYTINEIAVVAYSSSGRKYLLAHTLLSTPITILVNNTFYVAVQLGPLLRIPMIWYWYYYHYSDLGYDGDFEFKVQIANASRSRVVDVCHYTAINTFKYPGYYEGYGINRIWRVMPGYMLWLNDTALYIYITPALPADAYSRLDISFIRVSTSGLKYLSVVKITSFPETKTVNIAGVSTLLVGLLANAR